MSATTSTSAAAAGGGQEEEEEVAMEPSQMKITQDQFYSYFLTRCAEYKIRKPNTWVLSLLDDFSSSAPDSSPSLPPASFTSASSSSSSTTKKGGEPNYQLAADAGRSKYGEGEATTGKSIELQKQQQQEEEYPRLQRPALKVDSRISAVSKKNALVCLHDRTELIVPSTVVLGNTTLLILIEMLYFCPDLDYIDISSQRVYDCDASRMSPTGNEVLLALFKWASTHSSVAAINLGTKHCQIGTQVGHGILQAVLANPRLTDVIFDERGIEKSTLADLKRALRINKSTSSPISTAIRAIHEISPELTKRMHSMTSLGHAVDRKTASERRALLTILYDRPKLFFPVLDQAQEEEEENMRRRGDVDEKALAVKAAPAVEDLKQHRFVTPARQWRLSEGGFLREQQDVQGVRGDGTHLFIIGGGTVTFRLGSFDLNFSRGDVFGEELADLMYASGLVVKRSESGFLFAIPFSVCRPLFSAWDKKVARFLPSIKTCAMLTALPVYIQARCCFDAQLVNISAPKTRVIKSGDPFLGLFLVLRGVFRLRPQKHVAAFLKSKEERKIKEQDGLATSSLHLLSVSSSATSSSSPSSSVNPTPSTVPSSLVTAVECVKNPALANNNTSNSEGVIDFDLGSLFGEEALVNRRNHSSVNVDCIPSAASTLPVPSSTSSSQKKGNQKQSEEDQEQEEEENAEWQLLQLDATFCKTVLYQALHTVFLLQARSYGADWAKLEPSTPTTKQEEEEEKEQGEGEN